jgi:DNA ligase-1
MLAKAWSGSDPKGWWMSEKLDGMRAYWTGYELYTRNGNIIVAPDWFLAVLPPGVALDGEIYMGRGRFQEVMSVARKATARDPRWDQVLYMAFDAPEVVGGCEARFDALRGFVADACRRWRRGGSCPLVFVDQQRCTSKSELTRFHQEISKLRGEGVMLRAPGSAYSRTRTSDLLKVKNFLDTEARITGYTEGTGKHAGRLGAYEAKLIAGSKAAFKIGTGISDAERDRPLPIGTIVTVQFQEYTQDGVPRFPSLVGARDYE